MATTATDRLSRIWQSPTGLWGLLTAVNHRAVGMRFMVTAFVFFLLAGLEAVAIRLQLAQPLLDVLTPTQFNQTFTMHGATMMFLFAVPFLEGLGIYLVPLMIGTRDMAFPRLNAFGYWVFLIAGVTLYASYLFGVAPDGGWYNYPPLTGPGYRPGANIDFWVTMITFLEVSALVAAVELIVTILKQRAPAMGLNRMPVFVWAMLIMAFVILFAMPALILTSLLLGLDRFAGTHFFNAAAGGEPLLWQHLFWFFGHPDVYIVLLPAIGIISMVIPVFARRALAGYTLVVVATVIIGVLSFGVWVHHMYTTGIALLGLNFFAAASMLITIPSAVQIFAWITTIWRGRVPFLSSAMLFAIGFIVLFILGGITGIMIASVPFDWQVHDTYFIIAHFHYVLVGGVVFPIFAAIYFWFPKFTGRMLDERLGQWHFWLFLAGFNVTFFPMHITGFEGMPRRVYTYLPGLGWDGLNLISTAGAGMMGLAMLVFVWNVARSRFAGPHAGADPWKAGTLEWATDSPPPNYNFRLLPIVRRRDPLWAGAEPGPFAEEPMPPWRQEMADPRADEREVVATTVLDAAPDSIQTLPGPSLWPLWLALALSVAFIGVIASVVFVPIGLLLAFVALVGWHWPRQEEAGSASGALETRVAGSRSPLLWGVALLVTIEATVMSLFVVSYFYLRLGVVAWPPPEIGLPDLLRPTLATALLLVSPVPAWLGLRWLIRGRRGPLLVALPVGVALVASYLGLLALESMGKDYDWKLNAYASADWSMSAYAGVHAVFVILAAGTIWVLTARGHFGEHRYAGVQALILYWVFVAAGSLLFYATQVLSPYVT